MSHDTPNERPQTPTPYIPAAEALPALIAALPPDEFYAEQFRFTRARQVSFLRRLADCGEVRAAAKAASVSHQTVYRLRRACPTFRRACDAAHVIARELAEDMLATRAMNGVEEEVYYHGEAVAVRKRYDSRLLLAHLARLDRKAESEDAAALAGEFDTLLDALGSDVEGEAEKVIEAADEAAMEATIAAQVTEQIVAEKAAQRVADAAKEMEGERERGENAPRACNMRSKSPDPARLQGQADEAVEVDPGEPAGEDAPDLETRLQAMERARPEGVATPDEVAESWEAADALEAAQLAAFEAGEDGWWALGLDQLHAHRGMAAPDHADPLSRAARQVDAASSDEGAAIVDPDDDRSPV